MFVCVRRFCVTRLQRDLSKGESKGDCDWCNLPVFYQKTQKNRKKNLLFKVFFSSIFCGLIENRQIDPGSKHSSGKFSFIYILL